MASRRSALRNMSMHSRQRHRNGAQGSRDQMLQGTSAVLRLAAILRFCIATTIIERQVRAPSNQRKQNGLPFGEILPRPV